MRKLITTLIPVFLLISSPVFAQFVTTPRPVSPAASVSQTIGLSTITIDYSRPNVKSPQGVDRTDQIWGQLVPYELTQLGFGHNKPAPWRAGANENTTISFTHDAKVEGQDIPAGLYGFHIIVHENDEATLIFSSNSESWGSFFYEESEDVLRVKIKSEESNYTESLSYRFVENGRDYTIAALDWEKKRFPFKISFDVQNIVLANIRNELRNTVGFGWNGYLSAAAYCNQNNISLEEGLAWADQAVNMQENFQTMSMKASLLTKLDRSSEADEIMTTAVDHPSATAPNLYTYGRQLIGSSQKEKAMEIFKKVEKNFPDHWLAPHGMARAYSAMGDYKKALKYEEIALEKAPAGSKPFLEGFVKLLKDGKDFN